MFQRTFAPGKFVVPALLGLVLTAGLATAQQGQHLFEWSGHRTFSGGSAYPGDYRDSYAGVPTTAEPSSAPVAGSAYFYYPPPAYISPAAPVYAGAPQNPGVIGSTSAYRPAASSDNVATIHMTVPENAEIWFDDAQTKQRGADRTFYSPPLTPSREFSYDVKARWMENGMEMTQNHRVTVRAGATVDVSFPTKQQ